MPYRIAVCASGRGSNLGALIEALKGHPEARIELVLGDRPAPALDLARRAGVATAILADPADGAEWLDLLERRDIDLVVLAGYLRLVPAAVVERYPGAMINIHPALLPRFGGPGMYGQRVHQEVLASGATESGATVHLVDREYDRGAIVAQSRVPVLAGDTPDSLAARVLEAEHRLLPAVVAAAVRQGHVVPLTEAHMEYDS